MYIDGKKIVKDYQKGVLLLKKACNANYYKACDNLGLIYMYSKAYDKAVKLYQRTCKKNNFQACNNLGVMYENGLGVKQDIEKTKQLYKKACAGGLKPSCKALKILDEYKKDYHDKSH